MLDLSERIRDYVDAASPSVTFDEIERGSGERVDRETGARQRIGRPGVLIGAVAIVVLAVALVVQLLPGSGPNAVSEADAALSQAATAAAARPPGVTPRSGQYLYYETTQLIQGLGPPAPKGVRQFLFEATQTVQTWVTRHGAGRQRIVIGPSRLVFPADRAAWEAAGSPSGFHPVGSDTSYPSTQQPIGGPLVVEHGQYYLSYLNSSKFPTQPAALERYMERYFKIRGENQSAIFELAGTVLQVGASPALRAAIFDLIEHLHGVDLIGPVKDPMGRTGTGVAIHGKRNRTILIFDPKTSAVLGEKVISTKSATFSGQVTPKGTVVYSETFGTTGVVNTTKTYPDGQAAPTYVAPPDGGSPSETIFGPG